MWNPDSILLNNFISHKRTFYQFRNGKVVLIYGRNLDDMDGADSNGAGKSTLIKGITIGLIGISGRDLAQEDFIMDDEKECTVLFKLFNPVNKMTLGIERTYFSNSKSALITLYENGLKNTQMTSVAEADKRIIELLDISKEDILNYFVINQENSHSFFKTGDTDKKRIISRFTNSSLMDNVLNKVKVDSIALETEVAEETKKIEGMNVRIETLKEQVEYEESNKEDESKERLTALNNELLELRNSLNKLSTKQQETSNNITILTKDLLKLKATTTDVTKIKEKIKLRKNIVSGKELELRETKKLKQETKTVLDGEIECPKCHHKWSTTDPSSNLKELKLVVLQCNTLQESLETDIDEGEKEIDRLKGLVNKTTEQSDKIISIEGKINRAKEDLNEYRSRISKKKIAITEYDVKIADAKSLKTNKKRIGELHKQISDEQTAIDLIVEKIEQLGERKTKIDYWLVNFGMQGFQTYLVNKVLSSLEGYLNYNLKQFKTNLVVKILGYKKLKSGEIREKIDVFVSRNGCDWKKFNRLSGGQKARISVCSILSLQKLINLSSKSGGLNLLCLDEIFDSNLDTKGQKSAIDILIKSRITSLVISHKNQNVAFENQIVMEYKNGITKLIHENNRN